jgi:hypothetical protein
MAARYAEATFMPTGDLPVEFSAVSAGLITEALTFTQPLIGLAEWAEDASIAHALLAAHYLKRLGYGSNQSSAEPTYSRTVGPVSVGANTSLFQGSELLSTRYGSQYLMLFQSRAPAFGILAV